MKIFEKFSSIFSKPSSASDCVVALSKQTFVRCVTRIVLELFENGLKFYHLRKPNWPKSTFVRFIKAFPRKYRSRIFVNQFPELVKEFHLGGFQFSAAKGLGVPVNFRGNLEMRCERFSDVEKFGNACEKIMLGPIFQRQKRDLNVPARNLNEIKITLAAAKKAVPAAKFFAFGGISEKNLSTCKKLGFDGIAVVSAIWNSKNPLEAFKKLTKKW